MSNLSNNGELVNISRSDKFIRPDYNYPYKPKEPSRRFFSWINMNMPIEGSDTPKMHYMIIDELLCGKDSVQAMVHREGAKTTVLSKFLPLQVASTGEFFGFADIKRQFIKDAIQIIDEKKSPTASQLKKKERLLKSLSKQDDSVTNCVIFSATFEQAVDLLLDIRSAWDNSEQLQATLRLAKDSTGKTISDAKSYICFENDKGQRFHLQAKGAGQSMRGTKKDGVRPQLLIFDDILPDSILDNKNERAKLKRWFYSVACPAASSAGNIRIVVGTPMTEDDLLSEILNSNSFKSIKFPIANEFPVPEERIVSSWPDYHTKRKIWKDFMEAKEMGSEGDFYREKMLEVVNDDMRVFESDWFKEYEYSEIKDQLKEMNFFTTMDLAVSKKKHADFTVVITIGVNKDGVWFIVKVDVGRFPATKTMDILFEHVTKFRPLEVKAEKAALQQVFGDFLDERMIKTKTYFSYGGLENNSVTSKEYRINALQPKMKSGKIRFPKDIDQVGVAELIYEMKGYIKTGATTAHDDAVDCLANFLDPNFVFTPMPKSGTEVGESSDDFDNLYTEEYDDSYC